MSTVGYSDIPAFSQIACADFSAQSPYLYSPVFLSIGRTGAAFEDSAPPKLPATHGPPLDPNGVRHYTQQEWYFTDGSTPAETDASNPPTYATHAARNANTKL